MKKMMVLWRWDLVFRSIYSVGNNLDGETWRMMKGEVVSLAVERASNGDATYEDKRGFDLVVNSRDSNRVLIEVKSMKQIFYKESRSKERHTLKNKIQLKNTRGKKQQWEQDFDYLLLVQTCRPFIASLVPWEVVNRNTNPTGDQIKIVQLDEDDMAFITSKNGLDIELEESNVNLKSKIIKQITEFIDELERRAE